MTTTGKDRAVILASILLFLSISLVGWFTLGDITFIVSMAIMLGILITAQLETYRRFHHQLLAVFNNLAAREENYYRNTEALFSIFSSLGFSAPVPPMGKGAIAPDLAIQLVTLIQDTKPQLILEAGSGVSTLISACCLRQLGRGRIVSLEDQEYYAEITQRNLARHGLQDIATVIHAPLKEFSIQGQICLWYDIERLEGIDPIDMLIVDGPASTEELARYPALPILFALLADDAVLILDDAHLETQARMIDSWLQKFDCFEAERIRGEKGIGILRRVVRNN